MTYRVVWDDRALDELDGIRRQYPDKEGLNHVVSRLDTQLSHQPNEAGESRHRNYRVLFKYPLVVWFEIMDRMREVRIVHVRITKR